MMAASEYCSCSCSIFLYLLVTFCCAPVVSRRADCEAEMSLSFGASRYVTHRTINHNRLARGRPQSTDARAYPLPSRVNRTLEWARQATAYNSSGGL
eukprot:SAG31_NODE_3252_length_4490_cov_1.814165_2_plen_97_part_00